MADQFPPELLANCDTNHGPMLLVFGWLFLAIAIITVFLRLYFRYFYRNGLHLDDLVMLASLISGIIAVSWLTVLVNAGLGQHIYCLPPHQIPTAVHASILGQIFNILGIGFVKVSLCLTVLRIIDRGVSPLLKLFIWTLLVFACLSHFAQILLFIIQCRPMRAIWDVTLVREGRAHCFSSHITYLAGYIGFGLDAFTDLACSAIPIVIVNRLHLNPRTKTALCILIGLGSLTAACAVAKAVTLRGVFADDYTYALTNPAICTILEHLCGMILASLPALRPLVRQLLEGVSSAKRVSSTPSQHQNEKINNNNNNNNFYYNDKHVANGARARAGEGRKQRKPSALPLSPHSNSNSTSTTNPPPMAPALAVSTPRSPRFAAAATAATTTAASGIVGGGKTSNKKHRRNGSRTSWWAIPSDRKSWRKSVAAPFPPPHPPPSAPPPTFLPPPPPTTTKKQHMQGVGLSQSHWHNHPLHHHRGKGSNNNGDDGDDAMGSQDTTIIGSPSCSPGATPLKDRFGGIVKGGGVVEGDSLLLGPEQEAEDGGGGGGGGVDELERSKTAAAAPALGHITRTISFRVTREDSPNNHHHYRDGQRIYDDQNPGNLHDHHQQQHHEWPLNPLSPVDGVSPWYEDEEGLVGGRSPQEDYLRVRGWHRDF